MTRGLTALTLTTASLAVCATGRLGSARFTPALLYPGSIHAYDWRTANVNGSLAVRANGDELPGGMTCTVEEGSAVKTSLSVGAARNRGLASQERKGNVDLSYKATLNPIPFQPYDLGMTMSDVASASTSAHVYAQNCSADALGLHLVNARAHNTTIATQVEVDAAPRIFTRTWKVRGLSPATESDGSNSFSFWIRSDSFVAFAKATSPGGSGMAPVSTASASSTSKLFPKSLKVKQPGSSWIASIGSPLREITYLKLTRNDGVSENIHACHQSDNGETAFVALDLPNGALTITLVQPAFLKQTYYKDVMDEDLTTPLSLDLVFGDFNNDGVINQTDLNIINSHVGVTSSSTLDWYEVIPGTLVGGEINVTVGDMDINLDGVINSADVAVVTQNLGRSAT